VKSQSDKAKNGLLAEKTKSGKRSIKVKIGCQLGKVQTKFGRQGESWVYKT
jgi:hypothetical protein